MTKQEILDRFNDINFVYNDSTKHETLSRMLDELLKEQEHKDKMYRALEDDWKRLKKLLKEQDNKKLIDVDKLREKLGLAENCDKCARDSWKCGEDSFFSLTDFCSMLDIAIEELIQEGR